MKTEKKSGLDWKALGQLVSTLVSLFTLIRDTFVKMGVGLEIIGWATGEGKKAFVAEFLEPLGQKFLASRPKQVLKRVMVDLGAFPTLPFEGASVKNHTGSGVVPLERRADGLYLDGKKLGFYLSEHQQNGKTIQGFKLYEELTGKAVANANVMDALYEHQELIPEGWRLDEQGRTRYIFFWGTVYRNSVDVLYVRCLYFRDGVWYRHYYWLVNEWGVQDPAVVAS